MPLKCETCGRCHTRKGGCPKPEPNLKRALDALMAREPAPAPPDPLADLQRRAQRCESHHVCSCGELRRVELEARVAELERALRFYAKAEHYTDCTEDGGDFNAVTPIEKDAGAIARAALER